MNFKYMMRTQAALTQILATRTNRVLSGVQTRMTQRFQIQNIMGFCVGYYFLFQVLSFFVVEYMSTAESGTVAGASQKTTNMEIIFGMIKDLNDLAVLLTLVILLSQNVMQYIEENNLYLFQFLLCPCFRSQEQRDLIDRNN